MQTLELTFCDIEQAAKLLKEEQVIGFPTETVYGLGILYDSPLAFSRLVEVKERPENKPFTVMCGNKDQIREVAYVNAKIEKLMDTFMPGAITLLLKKKEHLPYFVTLESEFVGVRIPDHPLVLSLLEKVGKPLLVPSANKSGKPPLSTYEEVKNVFNHEIAAFFLENSGGQKPSTIVKIDGDSLTLIREGSLSFEKIKEVWEEK